MSQARTAEQVEREIDQFLTLMREAFTADLELSFLEYQLGRIFHDKIAEQIKARFGGWSIQDLGAAVGVLQATQRAEKADAETQERIEVEIAERTKAKPKGSHLN